MVSAVQKDPASYGNLSTSVPRAQEIAEEFRAYQDAEGQCQKLMFSFTDSHPEARSGFVDEVGWKPLEVVVPEPWSEPFSPEELAVLRQVLAQDPRPSYQEDATRVYGMPYGCHDVRFRVVGAILTVVEVKEQSARIG